MTLKIGFVCQWFPPEPVMIPPSIVDALRRRGAEVEVLTGIPNYPTGEVSAGYHAWAIRTEELGGVTVHRTPLYPSHDSKSIARFMNYGSWALSSALLGARRLRDKDVNLVYSSPATSALPAMVAESLFKIPYVLLVQDLWPDSVVASGMVPRRIAPAMSRLLSTFVNLTYRSAARILVISPGMVEALVSRGVPRQKIELIYNWVERPAEVGDYDRKDWRRRLGIADDDFVVMYAGNHGAAQALDSAVDGAGLVSNPSIHLLLVGSGIERSDLIERAARQKAGNVHFLSAVPSSEMPALMATADAQLVSLADRPLFSITIPSKLQSCFASGQPVLAVARGDVARIVKSAGAGLVVEPGNPRLFAEALETFARLPRDQRVELGRRGQQFYDVHMDEKVGGGRLFRALESATRRSAARVESAGNPV